MDVESAATARAPASRRKGWVVAGGLGLLTVLCLSIALFGIAAVNPYLQRTSLPANYSSSFPPFPSHPSFPPFPAFPPFPTSPPFPPSLPASPVSVEPASAASGAPVNFTKFLFPTMEQMPVLQRIYDHQHPPDCSTAKFVVWKFPPQHSTRNLGSVYTNIMRWVPFAMLTGRVLILDDRDWALADCPSKNSECYFLPVSSCSMADVDALPAAERVKIENLDERYYHELKGKHGEKRAWLAPGSWWFITGRDDKYQETLLWPALPTQHGCYTWSASLHYLLRPQPWVRSALERVLAGSFPPDFDPQRALGMPIRASDKCRGHSVKNSAGGETDCIHPWTYMEIAEKLRRFDPRLNTLLLSSEDQNAIAAVQAYNAANFTAERRWRILTNKGDDAKGSGSATYFVQQARTGALSLSHQMIAAMSSIQFQMRSRYLLVTKRASFHMLMHIMHLEDGSTLARGRKQIDPYTTDVVVNPKLAGYQSHSILTC